MVHVHKALEGCLQVAHMMNQEYHTLAMTGNVAEMV